MKFEKLWAVFDGIESLTPVISQVAPLYQFVTGIAPPFLAWIYLPAAAVNAPVPSVRIEPELTTVPSFSFADGAHAGRTSRAPFSMIQLPETDTMPFTSILPDALTRNVADPPIISRAPGLTVNWSAETDAAAVTV